MSYLWYNVFVKEAGVEILKTSDVAKLLSVSELATLSSLKGFILKGGVVNDKRKKRKRSV